MIASIKISLPQDQEIKKMLKAKMIEYEKRVIRLKKRSRLSNPDFAYNSLPGYKALIVRRLYYSKEVQTDQLARELREEFGRLDADLFNKAVRVIADYCKTGGKHVKKAADSHDV